jgi:hypothetical protein
MCETHACQNNATCVAGVDTYTCSCSTGWTGALCDEEVDACADEACFPLGTSACFNTGPGLFDCKCLDNWSGLFCEIEAIDQCELGLCQNDAECTNLSGNEFYCRCTNEWIGSLCTIAVTPNSNVAVSLSLSIGSFESPEDAAAALVASLLAANPDSIAEQFEVTNATTVVNAEGDLEYYIVFDIQSTEGSNAEMLVEAMEVEDGLSDFQITSVDRAVETTGTDEDGADAVEQEDNLLLVAILGATGGALLFAAFYYGYTKRGDHNSQQKKYVTNYTMPN